MSGGKHCYPKSETLINKYNLRNKELLEKLEIQKVGVRLLGLDVKPESVAYTFDTDHLMQLHKYLFGDIYDWARTIRDEIFLKVNVYCPVDLQSMQTIKILQKN